MISVGSFHSHRKVCDSDSSGFLTCVCLCSESRSQTEVPATQRPVHVPSYIHPSSAFLLFGQPLRNARAFEWNSSRSSSIFGCRWVERRGSIYGAPDPEPQRASGRAQDHRTSGLRGLDLNIRAWQWVMIVYHYILPMLKWKCQWIRAIYWM